ncbi:MAG TPA: VOC family protein [Acidimicrobiales bacterium]|nr:VOC family protein [Acidimicrobiales bacterium]
MAHYESRDYPTVCPYVFYRDGNAALDYLTRVLGFTERMRTTTADGNVGHAEVQLGESVVMVACPPEHVTPMELGVTTVGLYVHVEDVDAHYRRVVDAGTETDDEPTDQRYGVRSYGLKDPEGHQWWFSQPSTP